MRVKTSAILRAADTLAGGGSTMAIPQTTNGTLGRTIGVVAAFFIAGVFAVGVLLGNLPSFNLGLPAFIVGEPFEEVG